ncbi:MAG: hypothetical protein EA393_06035 [Bacteroidetes bacterium]|nr:MAG: hypothetical protein EA393_06035 [Bacteroidota bacterium]
MNENGSKYKERITRLFAEALEVPPSEWKFWVDSHCSVEEKKAGIDTHLLRLLKSTPRADAFFDALNQNLEQDLKSQPEDIPYKPGDLFDKFRIEKALGQGGMATVFLCERADGQFEQKVALKIMKVRGDAKLLKERFRQEQQILARFSHPNIAQLYDGGITEEGFPYMIMEYVEGEPIDKYCDKNKLSVNERINLFVSVCEAVQYAHNNLIIHLDLKPDNIFVTQSGRIKVLDFGIAALQNTKTKESNNSVPSRFLTLQSASPEQITGTSVTIKSDIYSLGLLLYRLLAGIHPHDFEKKDYAEIKNTIRDEEIKGASDRYKSLDLQLQNKIAQSRNLTPVSLIKKLKGDLNLILLKALQIQPDDRYDSITRLVDDIQSFKKLLPVNAHKATLKYYTSKFIRRNRVAISVFLTVFLIISGIVVYYSGKLKTERDYAVLEARKSEEVTAFLLELFEASNPAYAQGENITAYQMLEAGLVRSANMQNRQLQAIMLTTIGDALSRLSEFEKAVPVLEDAILKNTDAFGEKSVEVADAMVALGNCHGDNHMWDWALPYFEKAYDIYKEKLPEDHIKVLRAASRLGLAYRQNGETDRARKYSEKAFASISRNYSHSNPELLKTMSEYAVVIAHDEPDRAEKMMQDVLAGYLSFTDSLDYRLALPLNRLGFHYRNQENYHAAEKYYRKALNVSIHTMGEAHRFTHMVRMNLVTPLIRLGKYEEAGDYFRINLRTVRQRYSEEHWRTGNAYGAYASYYMQIGGYDKADSLLRINLDNYQKSIGSDNIWTAYVEGALAACNRFIGNYAFADSLYDRHMKIFRERFPDFNNDNISQINRLIRFHQEAEDNYEHIIAQYNALLELE